MKPFSQWTKEEIEDEFNLSADRQHLRLQEWIAVLPSFSEAEQKTLHHLSQKLLEHVHDWNEEELKICFIALLLNMVDFHQASYRPFLERELNVVYAEGKRLWGVVDFLVASGRQSPKQPFFFLHEYKRQLDTANDPLGQLLAEMVAAQAANAHSHPVYGAYVVGRHWYFIVLEEKNYGESLAYDATKADELLQIVSILKKTKALIEQLIQTMG
jgi:hypothetical protein